MGNSLGGKRSAKVMKINGETFKLKTPVQAGSVVANHPGHVLLESHAVTHFGVRAKPLEPHQELKPKRLYFLVELPKLPEERGARRVRSGIHMTAKDRLDSLMLARRSASDLSAVAPAGIVKDKMRISENGDGGVRVRMRLPKAEVERLVAECQDGAEAAEKIFGLYMSGGDASEHWNVDRGRAEWAPKLREKRVGFLPVKEGDIHVAMAS